MISAAIIASLILGLQPKLPIDTATRYATDIYNASDGDDELAVSLTTTHWEESRFEERIERCSCKSWECDHGAAFAAPQLHKHWMWGFKPAEVCASNTLAQALAARALNILRQRTGSIRRALVAYIGCKATDVRAKKRIAVFERLMREVAKGET